MAKTMDVLTNFAVAPNLSKTSVLIYIFAFFVILNVMVYKWRKRRTFRMLKEFNSLPCLPLIGNVHLIMCRAKDRVNKLLELYSKVETPVVFWFSYIPVICVTKYEDIQTVSTKSQMRHSLGVLENVLGDGIAISHPDKWRRIRRMINPAFGPSMLQQYLVVFNEQSEILCKKLRTEANTGKIIDLWQFMSDLNLDIITENMAGIKLQIQEKGENEFSESFTTSLKLEITRFFEPWLYPDILFYTYLFFTGQKDIYKRLHKLPKEVVRTKVKEYNDQRSNMTFGSNETEEKPPKTYIDILLRLRNNNPDFTEQQMEDEILNMIAAGSESTAVTSSFTLLMLAIHQEAQETVREEINAIFQDTNRRVQIDDLNKMKYLEQCIKETLRRFTLVPLMFRKTTDDITLNDNKIIPADCMIAMAYHGVHIDPKVYPNPDTWDPQHFSGDDKPAFVPFGLGSRACIGSKYAMLSVKTQVIHVLREYHLSTNITLDEIELTLDLIVRKKDGYPMMLSHRQNNNNKDLC